jgi:hypothetical protein
VKNLCLRFLAQHTCGQRPDIVLPLLLPPPLLLPLLLSVS